MGKVRQIGFLPGTPGCLNRLIAGQGVRAGRHQISDAVTKALPDISQPGYASLVLGGVVEERSDDLLLVAAVLEHERRDREEVAHIRDRETLADLGAVHRQSVGERLLRPPTEPRRDDRRVEGPTVVAHAQNGRTALHVADGSSVVGSAVSREPVEMNGMIRVPAAPPS